MICKDYEKSIELIHEFFNIQPSEKFGEEIFWTLKKIISFTSGYIFFTNPTRLEYSYNGNSTTITDIKQPYLEEDLKLKDTVFGKIIITGTNFSESDKKIFKACSSIIANITKDAEISKIIKMQVNALQEGYLQVQKNNKKIKEAEKIKTKFLSHISHELRTPLNSIIGFSDLLENEFVGRLNTKQKEYVNDIKISGLNLLEMINEILDMSKIETGSITLTLRKFCVQQAVEEVVNILNPLFIKKNITLETNIEDFILNADFQKFRQMLFNLLSNAVKYTQEGGIIKIEAKQEDNYAVISVKDNGIGIDKKNHKRIFKKFEQIGEGRTNSTGLGLSITKELVKLHRGEITVKSALGKGSVFTIRLPS